MNGSIVLSRCGRLSVAILITAVLVMAALVPVAEISAQEEDMEAVVNAIWTEYEDSLKAGDVDRWVQLWTEDGVQMPPGEPPVVGKANILERNKAAFAPFDVDMSITNLEYQVAGNWAFARGVYTATLTPKAGGDAIPVDGKYMTILQKQPDGTWKVHRDIFNSNVPPAPATAQADNAALSAQLHARFSANDLEGALALADDDMELVAYASGLDVKGKDKFLAWMQAKKRAFPDLTVEHINVVDSGDQVAVEFVATGTHTGPLATPTGDVAATGKPVTLHVIEVHTWRDGRLVRLVQYQDLASMLRQVGAME